MNETVTKLCPVCGLLKSLLRFGSRKNVEAGKIKPKCSQCTGRRGRQRDAQWRARKRAEACPPASPVLPSP